MELTIKASGSPPISKRASATCGSSIWMRASKISFIFTTGTIASSGEKTGVPAETVNSWRFQRRQGVDKRFHALAVKPELPEIAKTGTVTMTDKMPKNPYSILVTLPDGIRVESFDANAIAVNV